MKHLVTFSDENMDRASQLCAVMAKVHGQVDSTWIYEPAAVARFRSNLAWLKERGCGFWWWKPQIILDALTGCNLTQLINAPKDGDIVIYSDAGVEFIESADYIIDRMDHDIFLFGNNWEHAHWCKRDVIDQVWPESYTLENMAALDEWYDNYKSDVTPWSRYGKQVQASVIFFRVSDYTRKFVKEWLDWCLFEGGRLIDDSPSRTPNHPEFREHRHDQAILTTMAYREGLTLHYWPAQYNDGAFTYEKLPEYASDDYPILFHHHRKRNTDWEQAA